jgi:capsular exopolysaccharide synthesis family protein
VRTALQFSTPEGAPRVILVTSSVAGEGKSTTSLSLAIHFAQASKKVLLIDADLRNPSLHQELGVDNSCGLTNYLAGNAKPVDIAKPAAVENLNGLFVVTAGTLPPNPAELLSTPKMMSFLSLAAKKFDQIIVDGPPVLGLADALILGNICDATLLIIEANGTRRGAVQGSLKRLRSSRTRVLGGILTKLETNSHAYGYQQSYYYYHDSANDQKRLPS